MTIRDDAIRHSGSYFDSGRFQSDLAILVAVQSESQEESGLKALRDYLEINMAPMLTEMGFEWRIAENPKNENNPFLLAERIESAELPTFLTYGHGDVTRGQEDQWREGLSPYKLTEEQDRLYARGSADNKGQHLINIKALKSLLVTQGKLGFNVKLLLESGEEVGSPGLKEFCEKNAEQLKADVFIASDGPRISPDIPTIFTGSRGGMNFGLEVNLREGAHHSGNFGGLLADPAIILAHALSTITDARGQLQIPEWRPSSLSEQVKEVLSHLPPVDAGFELDPDWGEETLSLSERVFGWNSFAVLAMRSGVPEAPVNAISGHAKATCQLRYVVGTDVEDILPSLRRHLDTHGLQQVEIVETKEKPFPATRLNLDDPWLLFAAKSLETTSKQTPHLLPNLGGSLPNDCFADVLGLPTIWIPHSYAGCCQHSPNEHLLKSIARQALLCMTGLFADIAVLARQNKNFTSQ